MTQDTDCSLCMRNKRKRRTTTLPKRTRKSGARFFSTTGMMYGEAAVASELIKNAMVGLEAHQRAEKRGEDGVIDANNQKMTTIQIGK